MVITTIIIMDTIIILSILFFVINQEIKHIAAIPNTICLVRVTSKKSKVMLNSAFR